MEQGDLLRDVENRRTMESPFVNTEEAQKLELLSLLISFSVGFQNTCLTLKSREAKPRE